jgi:hypothetical protein
LASIGLQDAVAGNLCILTENSNPKSDAPVAERHYCLKNDIAPRRNNGLFTEESGPKKDRFCPYKQQAECNFAKEMRCLCRRATGHGIPALHGRAITKLPK